MTGLLAGCPGAPVVLTGAAYGKFQGQHVPTGWADAYRTEADVFHGIEALNPALNPGTWACFQKFYPGATTAYNQLKSG
ncbi:MAG: hypothetical protein JWM80_3163 [Cyanobacteria bacterium RYN_339]|nr:hypothetical protein [Cyanobacteria bacterium RYN_339]